LYGDSTYEVVMRSGRCGLYWTAVVSVATMMIVGAFSFASVADGDQSDLNPCTLISASQVTSILGLSHVEVVKDLIDHSSQHDTLGVLHSVCWEVAWSGSMPTPKDALQRYHNGTLAVFNISTWHPDPISPYAVSVWEKTGYNRLIGASIQGELTLPGLTGASNAKAFLPPALGGHRTGATWSSVTGERIAAGTWWNDTSFRIIGISLGEAPSKPVVKQLKRFARIVVPAFGLS
jgi:hypothetical protein